MSCQCRHRVVSWITGQREWFGVIYGIDSGQGKTWRRGKADAGDGQKGWGAVLVCFRTGGASGVMRQTATATPPSFFLSHSCPFWPAAFPNPEEHILTFHFFLYLHNKSYGTSTNIGITYITAAINNRLLTNQVTEILRAHTRGSVCELNNDLLTETFNISNIIGLF